MERLGEAERLRRRQAHRLAMLAGGVVLVLGALVAAYLVLGSEFKVRR